MTAVVGAPCAGPSPARPPRASGRSVEVLAVHDGAMGRVATESVDEDGLRRAAVGARRIAAAAEAGSRRSPDPAPGRSHEGWDPARPAAPTPPRSRRRSPRAGAGPPRRPARRSCRRAACGRTSSGRHARASNGGRRDRRGSGRGVREPPLPRATGSRSSLASTPPCSGRRRWRRRCGACRRSAEHRGRRIASAAVNLVAVAAASPPLAQLDLDGAAAGPCAPDPRRLATGNAAGDHLVSSACGADVEGSPRRSSGGRRPAPRSPSRSATRGRGGGAPSSTLDAEPLELLGAVQALHHRSR